MRQWLGSILFTVYLFVSVLFYGSAALLAALLPRRYCYAVAVAWAQAGLAILRICCGLKHTVAGEQNLPEMPCVILMKHSSAWETLAQLTLFPTQTWVHKRELGWIPIFGWALRRLEGISIDRGAGRAAVEQVISQGRKRLSEGLWVVIFPEGTRVPPGQRKRYGLSGALLAVAAERPIVPVAHDAGRYWPRRGWLKREGTIQVVIGRPIATAGRDARDVIAEVENWIEQQVATLDERREAAAGS